MRRFPMADFKLPIVAGCLLARIAFAQESPTPALSLTETPSPSPSPIPSVAISARNVPLRFVPPPMEGTISLGIWDSNDKLVRVLHREAQIDSFTVEENSLSTTWDGKSDAGEDLPPGKYRARGYLVGKFNVENLGYAPKAPDTANDRVSVKLVINPLISDTRAAMEIAVATDGKASFLKTMDGLPLATIAVAPFVNRTLMEKNGEKAVDVWQEEKSTIVHLRVSNIDKMMAFDCGFFQLK